MIFIMMIIIISLNNYTIRRLWVFLRIHSYILVIVALTRHCRFNTRVCGRSPLATTEKVEEISFKYFIRTFLYC